MYGEKQEGVGEVSTTLPPSPSEELAWSGVAKGAMVFDQLGTCFFEEEATGCAEAERVVRVRLGGTFEDEAMFASGLEDRARFEGWKGN